MSHDTHRILSPTRVGGPGPSGLRGGSLVALPTPLAGNRLDESAFARLCIRQITAGTSALVVCGTTGEASALSHAEQQRLIEIAAECAAGQNPVIAGVGSAATAASIELAQAAENAGAAALLCVTPYYVRPSQEGIYQHMLAVHNAVNIPLILYDVPIRTGCALADDTVVRLAQLERMIGLKDATGDIARPARLRPRLKSSFLLLSGDDVTQCQYRRAGGDGCISVTANVAPVLCARMHAAYDYGYQEVFSRIAEMLAPLNRALFVEGNPVPLKYALQRMGLIPGELRLPLVALSTVHQETVDAAMDAVLHAERAISLMGALTEPGSRNAEIVFRAIASRHELAR